MVIKCQEYDDNSTKKRDDCIIKIVQEIPLKWARNCKYLLSIWAGTKLCWRFYWNEPGIVNTYLASEQYRKFQHLMYFFQMQKKFLLRCQPFMFLTHLEDSNKIVEFTFIQKFCGDEMLRWQTDFLLANFHIFKGCQHLFLGKHLLFLCSFCS